MRHLFPLVLCALLAGCQPGGTGSGGAEVAAANPISGEEIATTSLDAPQGKPAADAPDLPDPAPAGRVDDSAETGTAALPVTAAAPEAPTEPAPEPEAEAATVEPEAEAVPEEPAILKSAEQLLCEKRGGNFSSAEDGGARTCVRRTKDGGKRCDQESDCQGRCLARSNTCSPIDPLLGCNEILQDDGAAVTLCIN